MSAESQGSPLKLSTDEGGNEESAQNPPALSMDDQQKDSQPQFLDDAEYKLTKDRYVGDIDPVSKLR